MLEANYNSEIRNMKSMQRSDYLEYLGSLFRELHAGGTPQSFSRNESVTTFEVDHTEQTGESSPRAWGKAMRKMVSAASQGIARRASAHVQSCADREQLEEPVPETDLAGGCCVAATDT